MLRPNNRVNGMFIMESLFRFTVLGSLMAILSCTSIASTSSSSHKLSAPGDVKIKSTQRSCDIPPAYTGNLVFPSKYEGSGSARSTINTAAFAKYDSMTSPIDAFSRNVFKASHAFQKNPSHVQDLVCFIDMLYTWARANSMVGVKANTTGKAVRKWALATASSNYLAVQSLLSSRTSRSLNKDRARVIERWFARLADDVIKDYSERPILKINNHDYWAAWAVINVSLITQNQRYFDFALSVYDTAMSQIDGKGLLPNELRRKGRAFSYHNYAMLPLASIAALLHEKNVDFSVKNRSKIFALASVILEDDSLAKFKQYTGAKQSHYELNADGHLTWVAALLQIPAPDSDRDWNRNLNKFKGWQDHRYSRLGGGGCLRYSCESL